MEAPGKEMEEGGSITQAALVHRLSLAEPGPRKPSAVLKIANVINSHHSLGLASQQPHRKFANVIDSRTFGASRARSEG